MTIPIFGHFLWNFQLKLLLLVDYAKPFCWTLFFVFWMFHWMISFLLGLFPFAHLLVFFSRSIIAALARWETTAWISGIWSPSLLPLFFINKTSFFSLLFMFTFWVIFIMFMWCIFHWWCDCHNLPRKKSFQVGSSILCTWEYGNWFQNLTGSYSNIPSNHFIVTKVNDRKTLNTLKVCLLVDLEKKLKKQENDWARSLLQKGRWWWWWAR